MYFLKYHLLPMLDARIDVCTLVLFVSFHKNHTWLDGHVHINPQTFTSINEIIVRCEYIKSHESKTMMLHFNLIFIQLKV